MRAIRPGSSEDSITSALAPADRSKYSHHSATEPANDTTNAATVAAVMCRVADRVAPMMTIDSPIAIRMNPWHRSAKWPPSIVQSAVRDRPRNGVANPVRPPATSMADGEQPQQFPGMAAGQAAGDGQRAADRAPGEDPLVVPLQRAAQRDHHEHAAAHLLHGVGRADHPAQVVEGARQRRRHRQAEQREHDEQQADLDAFRVHPVGDPRGVGPGQPHHRQQQRRLEGAAHGGMLHQVVRQLRDREDVHQVEEQLDVRDPVAARAVPQQPPRGRGARGAGDAGGLRAHLLALTRRSPPGPACARGRSHPAWPARPRRA